MYWLIEDPNHIEILTKIKHQVAYVEVIPTSHNLHPIENEICALYIRPRDDSKGYIIPINHSETINSTIEDCLKVLNSIEYIYVRDRKEFLHYFCIKLYSVFSTLKVSLEAAKNHVLCQHPYLFTKSHKTPVYLQFS